MPDLVEPSPPYSPWRSGNEVSSPSHSVRLQFGQLDGASNESISGKSISQEEKSSSENRPENYLVIEIMSMEGVERVKDMIAGSLQTDPKGASPDRASLRGADESASSKQRKQSAHATSVERSLSEEGLSIQQGSASSSAFRSTQAEGNIKELVPEPRPVVHASENSFGSLVVNLQGDRPDTPRQPPTSNPFTQYAGRGSIDAMKARDTDYREAMLQEGFVGLQRKNSTTSDATDLQSLRDYPISERQFPALQETVKERGTGLSDITNVGKTKAKKQDDESKAQKRMSQTKRAENKDEMTAASGDMQT